MGTILSVTGAAELSRPETDLICVREKLWYLVLQSIPNNASGTSGCHRGSAKFALCTFPELFSADPAPNIVQWPANSIQAHLLLLQQGSIFIALW